MPGLTNLGLSSLPFRKSLLSIESKLRYPDDFWLHNTYGEESRRLGGLSHCRHQVRVDVPPLVSDRVSTRVKKESLMDSYLMSFNRKIIRAVKAVLKGDAVFLEENFDVIHALKVQECYAESMPQCILQLYIIMVSWNHIDGEILTSFGRYDIILYFLF